MFTPKLAVAGHEWSSEPVHCARFAKTSTPPHAVSFCDFCLFSFLDTTAADVSDTQEQVASTRSLESSTRKFFTLFSFSARRFLHDAQRILQFGCGPFRRFCRTTQLFTITFFLILFISQPFFARLSGCASLLTGYKE